MFLFEDNGVMSAVDVERQMCMTVSVSVTVCVFLLTAGTAGYCCPVKCH